MTKVARPSWLLALVFALTLAALVAVILGGHEDNVWQVLEVATPALAALFVVDQLNTRSDTQDAKLEANHQVMSQVHEQVNGNLTARLDEAVAPLRAEIAQLREQITLTPEEAAGAAEQAYCRRHEG